MTSETYEGMLAGAGLKFAIIVSRFNSFLTLQLLDGAKDALRRHGVEDEGVHTVMVPGAFELPMVAMRLARSGEYDAIICLGVVIRGSTPHFEYVAGAAANGIAQVGLQTGVPAVFGVVTTENIEQAIERCGTKAGNKGWDAGMTAIEMVQLMRTLPG
ncbi:MAG: 6,7-dimethyl-8-ribityllumazine synthase [Armatimonadota bacterium]|nr:6,7-dimethyl-8-ribityllumazine synthase [Armatimonadota bacterium]